MPAAPAPVQQRVADRHVDRERRGVHQPTRARDPHRGDEETEARDARREGVLVAAVDGFQGAADQSPHVRTGFGDAPLVEEAVEDAEQEVPGPARRVDGPQPAQWFAVRVLGVLPHRAQAEFLDRGFQRQVEDELLDEFRGLQQGVRLAGVLAQLLVEVTEESRVLLRSVSLGEVVADLARGAPPAPEGKELGCRVVARGEAPQRVVVLVEEAGDGRVRTGEVVEGLDQPVAVVEVRVLAEERVVPGLRLRQTLTGPCDEGLLDEAVVLAEPDEDAGEHPCRGGLGDPFVAPCLVGGRDPLGLLGLPVFLMETLTELIDRVAAGTQVVLQVEDLPLQVLDQGFPVHTSRRHRHSSLPSCRTRHRRPRVPRPSPFNPVQSCQP